MLNSKRNYSLIDRLKELDGRKVKVGIVGESDSKLLTYAAVNEYGASIAITQKMRRFLPTIGINVKASTTHIVIPERSYIRSTFDNKKYFEAMKKKLAPIFAKVLEGKNDPYDILEYIGLIYVSNVKSTIANMKEPPNHPVTIERKGKGKGLLIDSGRLVSSISFEVV